MAAFLAALVTDEAGAATPDAVVALASLAGVAQGAALYWRRSHPVPVMAGCLVGGLVVHLVAPGGVLPWAGLVAIASLAAARPPRVSLPALAALLALTSLNFRTEPRGDALFALALAVLVWALGEATRNRRAAVAEAARRAVIEEQARIARELHDVLAHSVTGIVVRAAAADDVFEERPDQARAALRAIDAAGRSALAELRLLLATVRPDDGPEAGREQDRAAGRRNDRADERLPQPGLDRLGELDEPLCAAGLSVALTVRVPDPLPAGVEVSAYRIVQESLTNVLRHARARRVEVTVRLAESAGAGGALEVEVLDDGAGAGAGTGAGAGVRAGANAPGYGLLGMRERAALLGGTLTAGPRTDEPGFRVHAHLPLREPAARPALPMPEGGRRP
ncbi:sensor histidine kinase [Streptomyces sp. 3MP-14]|uniref:histidine kinase n=2 Tax=Streptomyces TaxID=1883 RepID=A0A5N6APJ1_9ACTN|nr:sensor histidine kinase [Streptomyces mimosae]KAB8178744.1 sensor histidine kinase [Streptomyces sp. 3MP-14]